MKAQLIRYRIIKAQLIRYRIIIKAQLKEKENKQH